MDLWAYAILFLGFASVVAAGWAGSFWLDARARWRARLGPSGAGGAADSHREPAAAARALQRVAAPAAQLAATVAQPRDEAERSRLHLRLAQAGWRSKGAPVTFFALKTALMVACPAIAALVLESSAARVSTASAGAVLLAAAAMGAYAPNAVLRAAVARRQRALFEAFPDAIDLMVVCVEAGLGLDGAIQRAAQDMRLRSAVLADELQRVVLELRVGATREQALRQLALRTGVEEIGLFVAALLQAERFGTAVADSMRVHAEELRLRRSNRAEAAAQRVPTQLLFPLMLTLFPALMVVLVGPAAIALARQIGPMMRAL